MEPFATLKDFIAFYEPKGGYNWFYSENPWLESEGFTLPIDQLYLQTFYRNDMLSKNLKPVQSYQDNYEETFNYFLYNYKPSGFSTVKSHNAGIEGFINNIPEGISKTYTQTKDAISSIFTGITDIAKFLIIAAVIAFVIYIYFTNKK